MKLINVLVNGWYDNFEKTLFVLWMAEEHPITLSKLVSKRYVNYLELSGVITCLLKQGLLEVSLDSENTSNLERLSYCITEKGRDFIQTIRCIDFRSISSNPQ